MNIRINSNIHIHLEIQLCQIFYTNIFIIVIFLYQYIRIFDRVNLYECDTLPKKTRIHVSIEVHCNLLCWHAYCILPGKVKHFSAKLTNWVELIQIFDTREVLISMAIFTLVLLLHD